MNLKMKMNYIGIVAGILAFISLALPWWTMPFSGTITIEFMQVEMSGDITVYTYDARTQVKAMGIKESETMVDGFSIWYGYVALALMVVAGIAGIAGSLMVGKPGKRRLYAAGILALLAIIIFAAGLNNELFSYEEEEPGSPDITDVRASGSFGLFSRGTFSAWITGIGLMEFDYSTYLTFGFWLAVVATILAFVSLLKHPMVAPPPPTAPTPAPTPPSPAPTPVQKIHCVYCGAENPTHATFCMQCGKKLLKPS